MSTEPEMRPAIRRILVALDASESSRAAVQAAARLAAAVGAELEGIFVEDTNLLRLAGLPFARELRSATMAEERFDLVRAERELRLLARRAEQSLATAAAPLALKWSFRVRRGQVEAELLAAAQEADLILLGRVSSSVRRAHRLGSVARSVARRSMHSVMLLHHEHPPRPAIAVIYASIEKGNRALEAAVHLVSDPAESVHVLLVADHETSGPLRVAAAQWLAAHGRKAVFHEVPPGTASALVRAVHECGSGVLVVEASSPVLDDGGLEQLLESTPCPVVLVR